MERFNSLGVKPVISLILSFLLIFIVENTLQIKFYNFFLNFGYKFFLYLGCVKVIDYLFGINEQKLKLVKVLCCAGAVFILDNPRIRTMDVFKERYDDFDEVENMESAWMYTSMFNFNKSALFPIVDSTIVYAIEVTKTEPIFLKYDYSDLKQHKNENGVLIDYNEKTSNLYFKYSISEFKYFGYCDTAKYDVNWLN